MATTMRPMLLGDVVRFGNGRAIKPGGEGRYPVYGSNGIIGGCDEFRYENGVIIGRVGAYCGAVLYCPEKFWASDNTLVAFPANDGFDTKFLFYLLHDTKLSNYAGGAAQPLVTQTVLKQVKVSVPPLPVQRRIAGILSAYDELMENSQRRIRLLEAMARALYREWFVHFRFPGHESVPRVPSPLGEIPQGWEVGRLDAVLVLQRGFDLPRSKRVEGEVPIYAATGVIDFHNEAKVKAPGVVTGRSGTIGDVIYVQEDFWPLNTALWAKEFPKSEPLFAYYFLSSIDLKQFNAGAAVPTLNRNDIHGLDALIPPRYLQRKFQDVAGAMLKQARTLGLRIENLRRTRDLLLPRLLSGQIDVESLDHA